MMCGRFTLTVKPEYLIDLFEIAMFPDDYEERYNIAPTQPILAAVQSKEGLRAGFMKWGLIPSWVKVPKDFKPLINARSETLDEKVSFKHLLARRRCIIFADSFYEWKTVNHKKQPYRIMKADEKPFAFAGLWDRHAQLPGSGVTCTILTTEANEMISDIHNRMPVILDNKLTIEKWLNSENSFEEIRDILSPFDQDKMKLYPVSSIVNSIKNNGQDCILPLVL